MLQSLIIKNTNCINTAGFNDMLRNCPQLKAFDFDLDKVTGKDIAAAVRLAPRIENIKLVIENDSLTITDLCDILKGCSRLKSFSSFGNVTGIIPTGAEVHLSSLVHLQLDGCFLLTDSGLNELFKRCPYLKSVILRGTYISGEGMKGHNLKLKQLQTLHLEALHNITKAGLHEFMKLLGSDLRSLTLTQQFITGMEIAEWSPQFPCLQTLVMTRCLVIWTEPPGGVFSCHSLSDTGLVALLKQYGSTLKHLKVESIKITGDGLAGENLICPRLEVLDLQGCCFVTVTGLGVFLELAGDNLRDLKLYRGVTDLGKQFLKNVFCDTTRPDKHCRVFWYLVKSDLSSVRLCTRVHWTRHFLP